MKSNMPIEQFIGELERIENEKEDYALDTRKLTMELQETENENKKSVRPMLRIDNGEEGVFGPSDHVHGQIADRLEIPRKYYNKMMAEKPELLQTNVNTWWHQNPEKRIIRTVDNKARAYLSDRYQRLDNYFLITAILPTLKANKDSLTVQSHNLTDNRMYIQLMFPAITTQAVKVGDMIAAGLTITNSEIGLGAMEIWDMIWWLSCTNGMISTSIKRKTHLGGGDEFYFKDDTINRRHETLKLEIRDTVQNAMSENTLQRKVIDMKKAASDKVESKPSDFVEKVTKRFKLSEAESEGALVNMMKNDDMNRYGLMNGITWMAHEVENRDRQFDLERIASEVITLKASEWEVLAS